MPHFLRLPYFFKRGAFFQVGRISSSMPNFFKLNVAHFFKCGAYFQVCRILSSAAIFFTVAYFFKGAVIFQVWRIPKVCRIFSSVVLFFKYTAFRWRFITFCPTSLYYSHSAISWHWIKSPWSFTLFLRQPRKAKTTTS